MKPSSTQGVCTSTKSDVSISGSVIVIVPSSLIVIMLLGVISPRSKFLSDIFIEIGVGVAVGVTVAVGFGAFSERTRE